ncbi:MAG TPA: heavy metal translocating P-type ATPase, partial [Chryseobacterium sp.]|nr:heavy metal translocating P-type ATPase [Chryseobacterium sp.]
MDKHTLASSTDTGCCSDSGRSTGKNKKSATQEHAHVHEVPETTFEKIKVFLPAAMSLMLLGIGLLFDYGMKADWFTGYLRLFWYGAAYLPVGLPVLGQAAKSMRHGDVFSEFFLMGLATLGAFAIGEYPEGVAVMLFYTIGEIFQGMAVNRAKGNIAALLDQRPDEATIILPDGTFCEMHAREILPGQIIRLKPGEKVALDGRLQSEQSFFNTAALTGESVPQRKEKGSEILAGMINMDSVATLEVTTPYEDSKLSRILEMVQQASSQKAPTELFIRKFAKIYSPIVFFLAVGICLLPYFFVSDYIFRDWLYRALVFLVISCPCALVISIPLGYFGGIGAASRNGILFKGGNYLDLMAKIDAVVMDKTGTLTEGVFKVQE